MAKGVIAAIALGALLGLGIAIAAVLFFLYRRKQKEKARRELNSSTVPDTRYHKAELAAFHRPVELGVTRNERAELGTM